MSANSYQNSSESDESEIKEEKEDVQEMSERRMWKNVIVLSIVFLLNFLAYNGLSSLQSSLHVQEGMGVITQAILYISLALSSLFLTKITIRLLGHKWTIAISQLGYVLWMAANGYAVWATMIPASIIIGVCSATLWTAQSSYLTILASQYAVKSRQDYRSVMGRFFGFFYAFYKFSGVFGAIISSTVLNQRPANHTSPSNEDLQMICALNDCPNQQYNVSNSNFDPPSDKTLWTLVGVYIAVGAISFIICAIFVDGLPSSWLAEDQRGPKCSASIISSSLVATLVQMRHAQQLLLIPLTFYTGLDQTFLSADYTKSFVSCFLGIWMVGFTTIPEMVINAVSSWLSGKVMTYTGFLPVFLAGVVSAILYLTMLMVWNPSLENIIFFYIVPCFEGFADAIFQVQITTAHGLLFPTTSEAAFANFKLWQSMGRIQAFVYSSLICTETKLYILIGFFVLGISTFLIVILLYIRKIDDNTYALDSNLAKQSEKCDTVNGIKITNDSQVDEKSA